MRLRTKFSLFSSLLAVLIVGDVSVTLLIMEERHLLSNMDRNMEQTAKILQKASEESLLTGNSIALLNHMREVKNAEGVAYAQVVDLNGKIRAHTDPARIGTMDEAARTRSALSAAEELKQDYVSGSGETITEISHPVLVKGKKEAAAQIGFSRAVLTDAVNASLGETRRRIFRVALASLAFGIALALVLAAVLTRPIRKMAHAAGLIGRGKLGTRIDVKSRDELGDLARELNLMAARLAELDQMKQDFVSSVTHEFRSPLSAMKAHLDLFSRGRLGEVTKDQKESLAVLNDNAERLARFIDDLLDVARIERGKMDVAPEPFVLFEVLNDVCRLMRAQAEKKGIELLLEFPEKMPKVFADPVRTSQVMVNLISNAVKFTEKGNVTVKAEPNGKVVRVAVSDTGMGIPATELGRIFDKFEQVKDARKKLDGPKGTGLGLAIVKGLVEAQGGEIRAESAPGKGSTFFFTLPVSGEA